MYCASYFMLYSRETAAKIFNGYLKSFNVSNSVHLYTVYHGILAQDLGLKHTDGNYPKTMLLHFYIFTEDALCISVRHVINYTATPKTSFGT